MAHKKGQGSSRNGRDSPGQHRGIKVYGSEKVAPGKILVRQLGTLVHPGSNVGMGKDYTLFALMDGKVKYSRARGDRRIVSIVPRRGSRSRPRQARGERESAASGLTPRASGPRRSRLRPEMKFVDEVRIHVKAGDGGNGAVAWRREKYIPRGGPPAATAATAATWSWSSIPSSRPCSTTATSASTTRGAASTARART